MAASHAREHAGGRRGIGLAQQVPRRLQDLRMRIRALGRVQRGGDGRTSGQDLAAPLHQRHAAARALQAQPGLAAALGREVLVALEGSDLGGGVGRAVRQQAVQQEHVQQPHGRRLDAHRREGIEVHEPHLHVLHAAVAQRVQRTLAGAHGALGADGAVELVLDLQQAGAQLVVVATGVAHAQRLVGGVGPRQGFVQGVGIAVQPVVAHGQRGLGIALVAQAAHAQRGGVRQVEGIRPQALQAVLAALHEAVAQRGRCAEEVEQQEGLAPEIADQPEILVARDAGHGPVVVDARDGLHAAAVAVPQAHAVDALGAAHVGGAETRQGNGLVRGQSAGHAGDPQHLAGLRQGAQHELVDLGQLVEALLHRTARAGDEFDLRLAVVGRDVRMRERGTQCCRMRRERQPALGQHAQALLLDAAAHARQPVAWQRADFLLQLARHVASFLLPVDPCRDGT